jgi:ribose transport system ATP-binding protein
LGQGKEAQDALVKFDGIVKRFGGVAALKGVSLTLRPGEIVALLGENGAGKSTLIKTLAGIHEPDEGLITYRGAPYRHHPPRFGQRQPVAFIHQDLGLIDWMTIAENIALMIGYPRKSGFIDWRAAEAATAAALAQVACPLDPTMRVRDLTRTEKSLVAIARALAVDSDVLVLDEPSASLPADEVHRLFAALRPLKARGVGMIYISHRLDEVFEIADRIAVLRDGWMVGERDVAKTTPEELVSLVVGKAVQRFEGSPRLAGAPRRLAVRSLAVEGAGPVDFDVAQSAIVGLVGLRGAGHEAIGRALFGACPPKAISAGDGSESAFQRIRAKQYQMGTVPEPLNEQGWQLVDELNRGFNKAPWSGFISNIHLVTADNIAFDGGPKNIFDPDNGYRDQYKKIWGVK